MSTAEHLLESAILRVDKGMSYKEFMENPLLLGQAKDTNLSMDFMWTMAQYVVYTYKPSILEAQKEKLAKQYGYDIDDYKEV